MVRTENSKYLFEVLCSIFMSLVILQLKFNHVALNTLTAIVGLVITIAYLNSNTKTGS